MKIFSALFIITLSNAGLVNAQPVFKDLADDMLMPTPKLNRTGVFPQLSGQALVDFDNDGDLDIFVTNGKNAPNYFYLNDGKGNFINIAKELGLELEDLNLTSVGVGDFDNDGDADLLIGRQTLHNESEGYPLYFENTLDKGHLAFVDKTHEVGLHLIPKHLRAMGFAIADYDNDSYLDIYIASFDLSKASDMTDIVVQDDPNVLLKNLGKLKNKSSISFVDITSEADVAGVYSYGRDEATRDIKWRNHTWTVYSSDVNSDGLMDILALNEVPGGIDIFINKGNMQFSVLQQDELKLSGGWMGITSSDFNQDGLMDYFITNLGSETKSLGLPTNINIGTPLSENGTVNHYFLFGTKSNYLSEESADISVLPSTVLPPLRYDSEAGFNAYEFGWGATSIDALNLGIEDFYYVGGQYPGMPLNGIGRFFKNHGDLMFSDETYEYGLFNINSNSSVDFANAQNGYSVLAGDLNGDLFQDLVVVNGADHPSSNGEPGKIKLFLNQSKAEHDFNSLKVKLVGKASTRMAIGAKVELIRFKNSNKMSIQDLKLDLLKYLNDSNLVQKSEHYTIQMKEVVTTTSSFSALDPMLHFGLGDYHGLAIISVKWPSGNISNHIVNTKKDIITVRER